MSKLKRIIGVLLVMCALISCFSCKNNDGDKDEPSTPAKVLQPAEEKEWVNVTTFNDESMPAYMQPIWYTREVYDESVMFVGEDSSATLLYTPKGDVTVRNYQLNVTYVEGKDYVIEGNKIKRVADGDLPYFKQDQYFLKYPASVIIGVNPNECEFEFDGDRYLVFSEGTAITNKHIVVSYRTDDIWQGKIPQGQTDKVANFMNKLKSGESATVMFYGDSITVGCNASGTNYGGNINPYLPSWPHLVTKWLGDKYGVEINYLNEAVGGWNAKQGRDNFGNCVLWQAEDIDLLLLAFGMNDANTIRDEYADYIVEMAESYLERNPNGSVILVSPMNPNKQSSWVGNQPYFEQDLLEVADSMDNVAVAEVNSVFTHYESLGKRTRDWLANNINHPNDFGVRTYAQVILKTLAGDDFCEEIYK